MPSKKLIKPVIIALTALFGAFIITFICCVITLPKDTVAHNIMVEDVDLSGLTYDDALAAIKATRLFENQNIEIMCDGHTVTLSGNDMGLIATPEATAQKAFNYGKSGNIIEDGFTAVSLIFGKKHIVPVAELNHDALDSALGSFGSEIRGEVVNTTVTCSDGVATITPGKSGFDHNTDTARKEVLSAVNNEQFDNISVTLNSREPDPVTVEYVDAAIYADPIDAYFDVNGNEVMLIADVPGRYCNRDEVAAAIDTMNATGEPVTVPYYTSTANVTTEMLQPKLFANTLGSYSTNYYAGGNRGKNVARAASLINNTVIAPGEVFSFNDTVGPRSTENGFYSAPEYVSGQSVEGIGGGTCQVSTTLYSAALYADLGIVDRTEHMMAVGYAPLGQDATVAYGSIDFKIRNTTDYPIKIVSNTGGGKITVSIVGTAWNPARKVELKHSSGTNGENTYVRSTRLVYSEGQLISTDPLDSSMYAPHQPAATSETN